MLKALMVRPKMGSEKAMDMKLEGLEVTGPPEVTAMFGTYMLPIGLCSSSLCHFSL